MKKKSSSIKIRFNEETLFQSRTDAYNHYIKCLCNDQNNLDAWKDSVIEAIKEKKITRWDVIDNRLLGYPTNKSVMELMHNKDNEFIVRSVSNKMRSLLEEGLLHKEKIKVFSARKKEEAIIHQILEYFSPMVHTQAVLFSKSANDIPDFEQEARMALFRAIRQYDLDLKAHFASYALTIVRRVMKGYARSRRDDDYHLLLDEGIERNSEDDELYEYGESNMMSHFINMASCMQPHMLVSLLMKCGLINNKTIKTARKFFSSNPEEGDISPC
jgi:hypothetical protein